MDEESLINKIQSSYILENVFNYIKEEINIKEKLFLYSKEFQKKLDINIITLKEKYLNKIGFDLNYYFNSEMLEKDKEFLTKDYNEFLKQKKINKENIENIIYDIYENKNIKDIDEVKEDINQIENYEILISIFSPIFKIVSKTKNFSKKIYNLYFWQI